MKFFAIAPIAFFLISFSIASGASRNNSSASVDPAIWAESDVLASEQKFKAALEKTNVILDDARSKNNFRLWSEALIRSTQLQMSLGGFETAVRDLRAQPWPTDPAGRVLLNLFYAHALMQYQQVYGWEIRSREKTASNEEVDLKAWTNFQIGSEISRTFDDIMKNAQGLDGASPDFFDAYVQKNTYPKEVRPTLRDLVVFMAVHHLANSQYWTPREMSESYRVNSKLLANDPPTTRISAVDPVKHPLTKIASWLGEHREFHRKAGRREAALNAQYELLETLHSALTEDGDRQNVRDALRTIQSATGRTSVRNFPWWARGQAMLAQFLLVDDRPGRLIAVREEALAGMKGFPQSYGGKICASMVQEIERPNYSVINMTNDNLARRSILINYKNLSKLYFRAYAYDVEAHLKSARNGGDVFSLDTLRKEIQLGVAKPVAEWSNELQSTPDFAHHRKFITPPIKKTGGYAVLISSRPDFSGSNDLIQAARLLFSDLVMSTVSQRDSKLEIRVMSGEKGTAIKDANVTLYRFTWNSPPKAVETLQTNAQGYVQFSEPEKSKREYWNYFLAVRKDGLVAFELDRIYFISEPKIPGVTSSFVYTDRSIYRPQQRVLWKVAAYKGEPSTHTFETAPLDEEITVRLLDPNNQQVELKKVKVGPFGTISGEFGVPTGKPFGAWQVQVVGKYAGAATIRVEEYKRPTFEATMRDAQQPLRLNRKAKLQGEAKYYFGLGVSQGSVAWRVTRQEIAPLWWSWQPWGRGYGRSQGSSGTIASGISSLKVDGTFDIEFTPEADERKGLKTPGLTYNFSVEANVTDEGGETRTATRSYRLGFVSVEAQLKWDSSFFRAEQPISIPVTLTSLDGKTKSGKATYRLFKLKQPAVPSLPAELPRDASIIAADIFGGGATSEADLDRFANADDKKRARWETAFNWQANASLWSDDGEVASGELTHDARGVAEIRLPSIAESGVYRLQYETQDDYGALFKVSRPFFVASAKPNFAVPIAIFSEKPSVEVGSRAKFFVHSALSNQSFQIEIFRAGKQISRRTWVSGKDGPFFDLSVTSEDRGGYSVVVSGLRDHQFMREEISVQVPWTDRELKLEFSTFRDKIRPGAKETFKITIRNSDKTYLTKGTGEVLAYMYDRSLDLFGPHIFPSVVNLYPNGSAAPNMNLTLAAQPGFYWAGSFTQPSPIPSLQDDSLKFHSSYGIGGPGRRGRGEEMLMMKSGAMNSMAAMAPGGALMGGASDKIGSTAQDSSLAVAGEGEMKAKAVKSTSVPQSSVRTNFSETAFFKPNLISGKDGLVSVEFTVPDSVTTWNVLAHALTKDMRGGSVSKDTRSVKELMARPYVPRFLREGDEADVKVTVNNASEGALKGELHLDIEDPETSKSVASEFGLKPVDLKRKFSTNRNGSMTFSFPVKAPRKIGTYSFRVMANSGGISDGELRPFSVLPSRVHLAQSRFAALRNKDRKVLEFKDLAKNDDPTLMNEKMVATVDTQLFYGVLHSLPFLMNAAYDNVESTVNRFLASGMISSIFMKYPSVEKMARQFSTRKTQFEKFDASDANRRMTLEESPWLENSKGGAAGEGELTNILDSRIATSERDKALARLRKMQLPAGGFSWFEGGAPDQYMTEYVLLELGRALEFKVEVPKDLVVKAWGFTRNWLDENIERMLAHNCCHETITMINYAVSLYPDASWTGGHFDLAYRKKLLDYSFAGWKTHSPLLKGYLALTLHRLDRKSDAKLVWDSVMDSAKTDSQLGTFWAPEDRSWLWYNDTVETHAFSLRTLMELEPNDKRSDGLVQWLFLNKKLNHWKSSRATAEAIYAIVHYLDETKMLDVREVVSVDNGSHKTQMTFEPNVYTGAKNQIVLTAGEISAAKNSKITIEKGTPGLAFASATWQFSTDRLPKEDRGDFFSVSRTYLKRELNVQSKEWTLKPLAEGETLRVGDQIEVQISLRTKHEAEYVHLRDPRAAGFEPENVVSGYKWNLGISWYEETRDSGSNFFFSSLPVGEYTFKYRLRANMAGSFRIGPAVVQSFYAPEFNAYSSGYVMKIEASGK